MTVVKWTPLLENSSNHEDEFPTFEISVLHALNHSSSAPPPSSIPRMLSHGHCSNPIAPRNQYGFSVPYGGSDWPTTISEGLWLMFQVAEGVEYMHHLGMIHRDLKRDNIAYDRATATATILDFEQTCYIHEAQNWTRSGIVHSSGTPAYMVKLSPGRAKVVVFPHPVVYVTVCRLQKIRMVNCGHSQVIFSRWALLAVRAFFLRP